jgi:DNA-binding winged helix-turn-helix (wHTH) protein
MEETMMKEQRIHNEPRLGSDCHERSDDLIVSHQEACLRKAHTRPYEVNEIGADHVTSAREAYLARTSRGEADAALEFGRFRVLLRQRQLVADGVPIELGTRALDLLLVLLEADGSMVTKDELLKRGWPGIVVAEENLKVQICALRRALGEDRDFIRTEFGRGYRFTAAVRSTVNWTACGRTTRRGHRSNQSRFPNGFLGDRRTIGVSRGHGSRRLDPVHTEGAASGRVRRKRV